MCIIAGPTLPSLATKTKWSVSWCRVGMYCMCVAKGEGRRFIWLCSAGNGVDRSEWSANICMKMTLHIQDTHGFIYSLYRWAPGDIPQWQSAPKAISKTHTRAGWNKIRGKPAISPWLLIPLTTSASVSRCFTLFWSTVSCLNRLHWLLIQRLFYKQHNYTLFWPNNKHCI